MVVRAGSITVLYKQYGPGSILPIPLVAEKCTAENANDDAWVVPNTSRKIKVAKNERAGTLFVDTSCPC